MEKNESVQLTRRGALGLVVAGIAGTVVASSMRTPARAIGPASSITLVQNGVPAASVVIPAGADDQIRAAAKTLIDYVKLSSGAQLPLVEGVTPANTPIYLGSQPGVPAGVAPLLAGLDGDGYVIYPALDNLTIAGPTSWGTRYGVYELLERFLGVRWLIPGVNGDDFESHSTVTISSAPIVDEPFFRQRVLSNLGLGNSWNSTVPSPLWATRNRAHSQLSFSHNLHALISPAIFGDQANEPDTYRPDFFPLRNGQHVIPPVTQLTNWQPRFGATGIAQAAAQRIISFFTANPGTLSYSLGVNDGGGFSEDEVDTTVYSSLGPYSMSEPYYQFVKEVAEIVLAAHPDRLLGLLAYNSVIDPPSFALPNNVVPFVTRDRYRWVSAAAAQDDKDMLLAWRAVCNNVGIYDYTYGRVYAVPRMYTAAQGEAYSWAAAQGIRDYYTELYPLWGESPKEWITARLMWDPQRDPQALSTDWANRAVGSAAAPHILAFQQRWEQIWRDKVPLTSWFEGGLGGTYFNFYDASYLDAVTPADIATSRAELELAQQNAVTARHQARVASMLKTFAYYEASALSYPRPPAPLASAQEASALLEAEIAGVDAAIGWANSRKTILANFTGDPLRSHYLSSGRTTWTGWNCFSIWDLGKYIEAVQPGSANLRTRLAELATSTSANVRTLGETILAIADGDIVMLGQNTSFDTGNAAPWLIEYGDPLREPLSFVTTPTVGGGKSLRYPGGQRAGGISQEVAVTPGFFRNSFDVYASAGTWTGGIVIPTWILKNSTGGTIQTIQGRQVPLAQAKNQWVRMVHSDMLPATVATIQCYCSVVSLSGEMTLYVDNAQFVQIAS